MKRLLWFLLLVPGLVLAAGNGAPVNIVLERVKVNVHDRAAVERGAKFFATNCMTCHTMRYMDHNKLAQQAGITLDKMPLKNKEWWLGIVPPDLSLIARQRSAAWLYTYFHAFYKDDSRPTGYNNLLMPNSVMTNILAPMQGVQELRNMHRLSASSYGGTSTHYYTVLELVKSGTMSPDEYNHTINDLVTFLVYASDPSVIQRHRIGPWVLGFLAIFFVIAYLLKKVYWKRIQ